MSTKWKHVVAKKCGLDELARADDASGLKKALAARGWEAAELNFGFQAACGAGSLACAKLLLEPCSIVSVSRGARRAAEGNSPDCMALALARLEKEAAFVDFDLALGMRDADARRPAGLACARMALAKATPGAGGWALAELLAARMYERARALLLAGADMDAEITIPANAARSLRDGAAPCARGVWTAIRTIEASCFEDAPAGGASTGVRPPRGLQELAGSRDFMSAASSYSSDAERRMLRELIAMEDFERALLGQTDPARSKPASRL